MDVSKLWCTVGDVRSVPTSRSTPVVGIVLDDTHAVAAACAASSVESYTAIEGPNVATNAASLIRGVRRSDRVLLTVLSSQVVTTRLPMSTDMLDRVRFVHVATEAFVHGAATGGLRSIDRVQTTGLLSDPSKVQAGRLATALAVRTPAVSAKQLHSWVSGAGQGRDVAQVCPAVLASGSNDKLVVIVASATTAIMYSAQGQPLCFSTVPGGGLREVAGRLGSDGEARLRNVWAGGGGDPVAQFEVRTLAETVASDVRRTVNGLHADGYPVAADVVVVCNLGVGVLLSAALEDVGFSPQPPPKPPGVPLPEQLSGLAWLAAQVGLGAPRFGTSATLAQVKT